MIAPQPNFLLLKEICATVLSLDTYIDTKIQLHYDADCILRATQHYQSGRMTSALTYRSNTLDPLDMIVYGADGQVVENHTYSYDEDGKLITITGADAAGTVVFSKNHCYDRAKSGYVNLIPIGKKRSKIPGDNKDMIRARVDFLSAGYYQPLSDAINANAIKLLKDVKHPVVLDAGCGEGYYTHRLYDALTENGKKVKLFGTDISKFGLEAAGKHHAANGITYAAASSFEIPLPDHCVDLLVCIFSPYAEKEFLRVLKPGG